MIVFDYVAETWESCDSQVRVRFSQSDVTAVVVFSPASVYVVYYDWGSNYAVLHRLCSCFQLGPRAALTQHRSLLR